MEIPTKVDWALYAVAAATIVVGAWQFAPPVRAEGICCYNDDDCWDPLVPKYCDKELVDFNCQGPIAYMCRPL
jgi:hypothetical protein